METAPQITFHGMDASPAMLAIIDERIAKLERFHDRIVSCRVAVEKRTSKGHKGHLYKVALDIEVPGGSVIVNRKPGDMGAHEDMNVAIRDSFGAARRQLEDHARKADRVHVKAHPEKQHGTVDRLFAKDGYGFLKTPGGLDVYFDRESVLHDGWERLEIGSELEFSLMEGDKGPFAANVTVRA